MNRSILLALALGLLGCQASTPAASAPPEALLFTSAIDPSSADVERSIAQLARLDAVACRATRLALLPDLAHELFVRSPQASLRAEAVAALKDPGYRASQAARAASPEAHDRLRAAFVTWIEDQVGDAVDLRSGFEALGDSVLACEVAQRARARGLPLKRPTATVAIQRARAAWHELAAATRQGEPRPDLIEAALNAARAQQHLGVLEGIEQLCAASAVLLSPDERTRLSLDRARIALLRHDGARALRAAVVALRSAKQGATRRRARLLLARAQLQVGKQDAALAEAQRASEESAAADAHADEARALGLLGAIFLRMNQPEAAASAYEGALSAALRGGQPDFALRQRLNLATAALRAGRLGVARDAIQAAMAHEPVGPDRAELQGQRIVTAALVALVGGELRPAAAALKVEEALRAAREAGCPEILERYATLPARLRGAERAGS